MVWEQLETFISYFAMFGLETTTWELFQVMLRCSNGHLMDSFRPLQFHLIIATAATMWLAAEWFAAALCFGNRDRSFRLGSSVVAPWGWLTSWNLKPQLQLTAASVCCFQAMHAASLVLIFLFVVVFSIQERAEWQSFLHPNDRIYGTLWAVCSVYVQLVGQPLFLTIATKLVQAYDCTACSCTNAVDVHETDCVYAADCSEGSFRFDNDPASGLCYQGWHVYFLISSSIALLFYVPFCVRLMRVGGRLACIELQPAHSVLAPWWTPWWKEDDAVDPPYFHPLSPHSVSTMDGLSLPFRDAKRSPPSVLFVLHVLRWQGIHKVLTVLCKIVGVTTTTLFGDSSKQLMFALLSAVGLALLTVTSIPSLSPYHGRKANGLASGIDLTLLYCCERIDGTLFVSL